MGTFEGMAHVCSTSHSPGLGSRSPYSRRYTAAAHLRIPAATLLSSRLISVFPSLRRPTTNNHTNAPLRTFNKNRPSTLRLAPDPASTQHRPLCVLLCPYQRLLQLDMTEPVPLTRTQRPTISRPSSYAGS